MVARGCGAGGHGEMLSKDTKFQLYQSEEVLKNLMYMHSDYS